MEWKCRKCGTVWNNGFFGNNSCPSCTGIGRQIWKSIKGLILLGLLLAIILGALSLFSRPLLQTTIRGTFAALDTRTFYTFGPEAYTEAILKGQITGYYTLNQDRSAYQEIIPSDRLGDIRPLIRLSKGQNFILKAISRHGAEVWAAVEFYNQDTVERLFVLFPRSWEDSVTAYDMDRTKAARKKQYVSFIRKHLEVETVSKQENIEKRFIEEHPDYFMLPDMSNEDANFYTARLNQNKVDKIHAYFLDEVNIAKTVLQSDPQYKIAEIKLDSEN